MPIRVNIDIWLVNVECGYIHQYLQTSGIRAHVYYSPINMF